jgi:hypothetical protein
MNYANCCRLGCVLLLLCGACGDDDEAATGSPSTGEERDGGAGDDGAGDDSTDDDEPGDPGGAAGDGDAPSDAGGGSDPGSDPEPETDAATPPEETADAGSPPEEPSDAAVGADGAAPVTDCESLSACCEQLSGGMRKACENAIEIAEDAACVEIARVVCPGEGDGGMPGVMPCEEVLECCAALDGRQQTACEAAAAAPAGRACERAVETYCP